MVQARQSKIARIAAELPLLHVEGNEHSDTLLVGWGSTRGHLLAAADEVGCAAV